MTKDDVIHVAYADDHVSVRMGIAALLGTLKGIVVDIQADNGKDLIEKLQSTARLPDICLLDISMPVMNGFETIVEIRRRWPEMGVLVLTAFMLEQYIIRMIRLGAGGYILKKCNPLELQAALISIHEKGIYYSDLVQSKWVSAIQEDKIQASELSGTEIRVLKECCSDRSYEDIGRVLNMTKRAVEGHRDALFKKLEVNSRVSLALWAVRFGFIQIEAVG